MPRKYRTYSNEDIIKFASEVKSIAGLLRKLDLAACGGNYANIKRNLQKLNVDTSHWTGQCWNKNQQLKNWNEYTKSSALKPHLIKAKGHACEMCKLEKWLDRKIILEVHHIDGNATNNEFDNLLLLCPNCHSFTDNWRNRKHTKKFIV